MRRLIASSVARTMESLSFCRTRAEPEKCCSPNPLTRAMHETATFSRPSCTIATSSRANEIVASVYWLTASRVASATRRERPVWLAGPLAVPTKSSPPISSDTEADAWTPLIDALIEQMRGRATVEVSGWIGLERMPALVASGADFVSIDALTQSVPAADLVFQLTAMP